MSRFLKYCFLAGMPLLLAVHSVPADAAEWEKSSPYYEDDAWYDISEWLDGNDYNPADEAFGRWDDESYGSGVASDTYDYDYDDDFGYDEFDANDDWFYDYYDYDYSYYDDLDDAGDYSYSYKYYDYDNDGFSDAFASYTDSDGDGIYEDYDYYAFDTDFQFDTEDSQSSTTASSDNASSSDATASATADASQNQQQQRQSGAEKGLSSKRLSVTGTVERTKRAKVPQGPMRLIAEVKSQDGQMFLVDLGAANQFGWQSNQNSQSDSGQQAGRQNQQARSGQQASSGQQSDNQQGAGGQQGPQIVKQGEKITANGPAIKVGDKQLILAQTVKIGDADQRQIVRSGRSVSGKIASMKTAEVRGLTHQLAILELESGKQALVDLGRQENLPADLAEGDQIQVTGMPTKVKDRLVFIANSVTKDGDKTEIHRMTASARRQL